MLEQIAELAAEGYNPVRIATVVGIRVDKINEMLATDEGKNLVEKYKQRPREKVIEDKYERLENLALKTIESKIAMEETPVLIKLIDTLNRRAAANKAASVPSTPSHLTLVNLSIPSRMIPQDQQMVLNEQGEIVSVGSRNFAALPVSSVQELFQRMEIQNKKQAEIERVDKLFEEEVNGATK